MAEMNLVMVGVRYDVDDTSNSGRYPLPGFYPMRYNFGETKALTLSMPGGRIPIPQGFSSITPKRQEILKRNFLTLTLHL